MKFLAPIKGKDGRLRKHYQFTAIDDCTRLRVLRVYPRWDMQTAIALVDNVADRLPLRIDTIQTDNGAEFQTAFHWHVFDKGFGHTYIKPATPRLNGRVCEYRLGAAPAWSGSGQGVTVVSCVRLVGQVRCSTAVRAGQADDLIGAWIRSPITDLSPAWPARSIRLS